MRTIYYRLEVGYVGCHDEGELEVSDDMTDADIDAMVHEMALEWATTWEGDTRLAWDEDMTEEEHEEATESYYEGVEGSWVWTTEDDD